MEKTVEGRLATVEARLESVVEAIDHLAKSIREERASNQEIKEKLSRVGTTDTKQFLTLIGSVGSVVLVLIGGLWGMAISPMQQRLEQMHEDVAKNSYFREKVPETIREIETQFKGNATLRNELLHEQERLMSMLWSKNFGGQLPERRYWPTIGANGH